MWRKIKDFIEENKEEYNDFYSEINSFNDKMNYLRSHRKSRKFSFIKILTGLIVGIPAILTSVFTGLGLPFIIIEGFIVGALTIDGLQSILKYEHIHTTANRIGTKACLMKRAIQRRENAFKYHLLQSITESDCSLSKLNDLKSRLIDLEYTKDEMAKIPGSKIDKMSIYNEIELTEFLLTISNRLFEAIELDKKQGVTASTKPNEVVYVSHSNISSDDLTI